MHIVPMKYQHFRFDIVRLRLRQCHRSRTTRLNAATFKSARGPKVSLCVTFFAPSRGPTFCLISGWSKYATFSITFGALVLQITVCVAFGARRRAAPARLLGGALVTQAAQAGPDIQHIRAPSGFPAPRSPQSAPTLQQNFTTSTFRHRIGILRRRLRHAYEVARRNRAG